MRTSVLPACTAASRSALMPIDKVSKCGNARAACMSSNRCLACWCSANWASKPSTGSGMVIRPRKRRRGKAAISRAKASASCGATPDLVAPPSVLTWMQTLSGASVWGRCASRRWAILNRSTVCAQSKCSATARVLLLWIGPMQCHTSPAVRASLAKAVILATPSWM